jgi:hypothetical protein
LLITLGASLQSFQPLSSETAVTRLVLKSNQRGSTSIPLDETYPLLVFSPSSVMLGPEIAKKLDECLIESRPKRAHVVHVGVDLSGFGSFVGVVEEWDAPGHRINPRRAHVQVTLCRWIPPSHTSYHPSPSSTGVSGLIGRQKERV